MILEIGIAVSAAALLVLVLAVLAALMAAGKADESMRRQLADESAAFVAWLSDGVPAEQTRQLRAQARPQSRLQQRADAMAAQIRSRESEITAASIIADDDVATRQEAR